MTAIRTPAAALVFAALFTTTVLGATAPGARHALSIAEEHVTGGVLDLAWDNGFGVSNNMEPLTLDPADPAYANPSGDHTVGSATNSQAPDSGGVILTTIDPHGADDYTWEGWIFTGTGNTRRGLVVRADPTVQSFSGLPSKYISSYQFVIQSGLFQIAFRRVVGGAPTTLRAYNAAQLPAGSLPQNTWHKMKVEAFGSTFRCSIDGFEFTDLDSVINDATLPSGWAGCYNFSAFTGNVPVYFDDLVLGTVSTPARTASFGQIKAKWAR